MSATSGVNVLRYSALTFGVFYGFSHQRSINASNRVASEKREYEHKQQLIQKAKEEFAKKKNPAPLSSTSGGLNQDPMSSNFDLEEYFNALVKESP
ncbi:putative mitochondrial f0 subunit e [Diaporthe ampelina]|uniref:ATP synthase F(0) complex subunit e, mitochondrial n=1 Tax=Diaporthe ampelina TaxID=1214573 RepID=A0A0G2FAI6_9PEZI|nr:putative mitochondrial f0 subunit e [Diaporthe ampelina]